MNEKYKYLGKNTLLFTISSFGTRILSFFLVPLYTNVLTTAEYGTADLISTTATLLVYVLTIDIADAVLRYALDVQNGVPAGEIVRGGTIVKDGEAPSRTEEQWAILSYGNRVIVLSTLVCLLLLGATYATGLVGWPLRYFLFTAASFFASAFYQLMSNYLRAVDKVAAVAVAGVLSGLVSIVCNILFLLVLRTGVDGYLLAGVTGPLVASVYCVVVAGAPARTYLVDTCSDVMQGEMRRYCTPLIFNNVALWINAFLDRYFVTAMCGVDANGVYSVANKIPIILATCYQVFGQAWNLSAIREFDPEDSDGFFSKTYGVYNAAMCLACSVLVLMNVPLARFLYAKDFFQAWQYSSVLLIYVLFNSLTMLLGSVFSAVKHTKVIATTTVISAAVNTGLNFLLIPVIGVLGAAVSTAVSYVVMWAVRLVFARRYIRLRINLPVDCMVYGLVVLQVVLDHLPGHMYPGQVTCFVAILVIYRKQLKAMARPVKALIRRTFGRTDS